MLRRKQKGQSIVEYAVLIVIVMGSLVAMTNYIKRALHGRWKSVVDDLGDQYDPQLTEIKLNHFIVVNTDSTILAVPLAGGYWTSRVDQTNTVETKTGHMITGIDPGDGGAGGNESGGKPKIPPWKPKKPPLWR